MNKLLNQGKKIFTSEQTSILSAATIIMLMVGLSRVLGYVRQRVILHYFLPHESALFFASFRLPDLIFEVLVFGTFSSAFIPVFTKLIKGGNGKAWDTAGRVVNLGAIFFASFFVIVSLFAEPFYKIVAPGFSGEDIKKIADLSRILFIAQGFFMVSYVLTGVLESLRRFLIPALAPIFYNLGIIIGIVVFTPRFGLTAPAIGVVIGAAAHFLIQLPLAIKLGFRFTAKLGANEEVKKIGRLAAPRFLDLSFQQLARIVELNFSSLISTASYTYLTLANTLQLLPVGLFGTTVAKAALPTLARLEDSPEEFRKTFLSTLYQVLFVVFPVAALLIALRIPIVRLAYGTDLFDWEATIETSLALSAFAVGIPFQSALALLNRAYYAMHDTKTPVMISIFGVILTIATSFSLVKLLHQPVWALAAAFSFGIGVQTIILFFVLMRRINNFRLKETFSPILKVVFSSLSSGVFMFFMIKLFDRSVWVKRLSFLGAIDDKTIIPFEKFVLDTRYTFNLIILTFLVSLFGMAIYIALSWVLKSNELSILINILKRRKTSPVPQKESEIVAPSPTETVN